MPNVPPPPQAIYRGRVLFYSLPDLKLARTSEVIANYDDYEEALTSVNSERLRLLLRGLFANFAITNCALRLDSEIVPDVPGMFLKLAFENPLGQPVDELGAMSHLAHTISNGYPVSIQTTWSANSPIVRHELLGPGIRLGASGSQIANLFQLLCR